MKLEAFEGILPQGREGWSGIEITGIASDSRKVGPGYLFAALRGTRADGAAYIGDALRRGAAAILVDAASAASVPADTDVPVLAVEDARRTLALAAAR